jgi:thiamine biosynthesis lipoprotein
MPRNLLFAVSLLLLLCASCAHRSDFFKFDGRAQGTFYSVQYFDPQHRSLQQQIDSILLDFDRAVSLWVDSSNLSRLNRGDDSLLFPVTAEILEKSLLVNRLTDGAFDCRVGSLVNAWGFGAKNGCYPDSATIDSLLLVCRSAVGIRTDASGSKFFLRDDPRTEIDFNAIAQGYSVDLVARYLDSLGISNYLIDIGGEVIARGQKRDGHPWVVGIEKPADNRHSAPVVMQAVELSDAALVTSGNYRKYYEKDGVRYSHTIDPATGYPVNHSLLSVTVIDSTSWRADALATAFMVMGLDSALRFLDTHPVTPYVYFIYDDNGQYATYATPSFNKLISNQD